MKRKYMVMSSFFIAFFLLSVMCYGSYRYAEQVAMENRESREPEMAQTGGSKEQKITYDTRYILETYHEDTEELTREELSLPSEYTGMTRGELEAYLEECVKTMMQQEQEAGLSQMKLMSFSSEAIIIRKSYKEPEQETGFFLTIADGEVAIYNRSGTKLYEKTGILAEALPAEEQAELEKGFVVENEKDLYSILENFSS
ncbi:MAG: hypothetical protein J1F02_08315 [Lachnospiraceae bacterium]|nr:hypothetical protein [Lachnospiraceae bacterium]